MVNVRIKLGIIGSVHVVLVIRGELSHPVSLEISS